MSGRDASATWRPAVSAPTSAATSVANSRLTSPGASSHATSASASDSYRSAPSATNAWATATVASPVARRDQLGVAGERRDGREPDLLGQERDELQLRVQPGVQPAVRLEEHGLAEDDRRVGLVRAETPVPWRRRSPRSSPAPAGRPGRPSARTPASPSAGIAPIDAPVGHRGRQRPPRPVAGLGRPQRPPGQRERVPLRRPVVEPEPRDRRGRAARRHRARRRPRARWRRSSGPWPRTSARRRARPGRGARGRPRRPPGSRPRQTPVLIITCLTNV